MCPSLFLKHKLSKESPLLPILGNPQYAPGLWKGTFDTLIDRIRSGLSFYDSRILAYVPRVDIRNWSLSIGFLASGTIKKFLTYVWDHWHLWSQFTSIWSILYGERTTFPRCMLCWLHPWRTLLPFLQKWELDLGRTFLGGQYTHIIHSIFESSIYTEMQETKFQDSFPMELDPGFTS